MKKVLLSSLLILLSALAVFAYETVIIKYPPGELWQKAYYKKIGNEAILQYTPAEESHENWKRTIIVHSYYDSSLPINYFITRDLAKMSKTNPTGKYRYITLTPQDSMATRCTEDYNEVKAQCEFYRVTIAHEGIISLHYINRDKEDFMDNYHLWYNIIRRAKFLNSYYRDERTFDKSEYYELW